MRRVHFFTFTSLTFHSGLAILVLTLLFSCAAQASLPGGQGIAVTELPGGEREISASAGSQVTRLNFSANGELLSWIDTEGNAQLTSPGRDWEGTRYALEVLDPAKRNTRLYPADKATIETKPISNSSIQVTVTTPDELKVIYTLSSSRLEISVDGPLPKYLLRMRRPTRLEGCRIEANHKIFIPSAGLGQVEGSPQELSDARLTRLLSLTLPEGLAVTWGSEQTTGWGQVSEQLWWLIELAPGQSLRFDTHTWISTPTKIGLTTRRNFRPASGPVVIAEVGTRLLAGKPVTLTLSKPIDEVINGGRLIAALYPVTPDDPIEASEQGVWYQRFDRAMERMIPVELTRDGDAWKLAPTKTTPAGAYRLRMWVVPGDTLLPEALGGPLGAVVGYFPGFQGRGTAAAQSYPCGDVMVTVGVVLSTEIGVPDTGSLTVINPSLRTNFWRGEPVALLIHARKNITGSQSVQVNVRQQDSGVSVATIPVKIAMRGTGATELRLSTGTLAPGTYVVTATAQRYNSYPYTFTIAPPRASGMPDINSPMGAPGDLEANVKLGVSMWADELPMVYAPGWPLPAPTAQGLSAANPSLPQNGLPLPSGYDQLQRENILLLQGVQSRQISFGLHHTIPEHVDETLRKYQMFAQFNRRFPGALGLVFDYDLSGATGYYGYEEAYTKSWKRRLELHTANWEAYWAKAKAAGATDAEMGRYKALFNGGVVADLYGKGESLLRAAAPEQRHSSDPTADHNYIQEGHYLPLMFKALDYRYLEVWNDQVYCNSAHDMQESFWTSLLRMDKPAGQPVWVTVPAAPQAGTHFHRTLEAISHGANGTGYNAEGAAGLTGGWGATPTHPDVRSAQERLSGELAKQYGTWLNQFEPAEEVAILYSISQGGTNWGMQSPIFYAYYTLAQINRPARLLTEEEIAGGALKSVKALIVVRQSAPLPADTLKSIDAFIAAGGKVFTDKDTTLEIPGAQKLASVSWPGSLWPNGGNKFHNLLRDFVTGMGEPLTAALGEAGRQPLESTGKPVLTATKRAAGGSLVMVTNADYLPTESLFTADQQISRFMREYNRVGLWGYFKKDVVIPGTATLRLRPDLAANPLHIYDVFAGKELPITRDGAVATVTIDLASLSGRALLLTDKLLPAPQVLLAARKPADPLATLVVKSPLPLPIRVRVAGQEVYRAATPQGSYNTFALGPKPGAVPVEVTELVTGQMQKATLTLTAPASAPIRELPAVQVWDVARIRQVLKSPDAALYVDGRQAGQREAAGKLAMQLGIQLVYNPPVAEYQVDWDLPEEAVKANEAILRSHTLAARRAARYGVQWTGAMTPAIAWNRPVILFGNALNNRLIADLNAATALMRPALPDYIGQGRAIVQPVAAPFWNGSNAVVVLCDDNAGLQGAFAKLAAIAAGKPVPDALEMSVDGGARAERRRLLGLGLEPAAYPATLPVPLATAKEQARVSLQPVLPVNNIAAAGDSVLVTLHTAGRNLARLGADGKVVWQAPTAGFNVPGPLFASAAGQAVVFDDQFTWYHDADGKVRWKMLAAPIRAPEADGSTWVRVDDTLKRIAPTGEKVAEYALKEPFLALSPDAKTVYVQRKGKTPTEKADSSLVAVEPATGQEHWSVPNLQAAEVQLSTDGALLAAIEQENMGSRDDLESDNPSRLTVIDAVTGKAIFRHPLGQKIDSLQIAPDNARVAARKQGFSDTVYVAEVATGVIRAVKLPERGIYAYCFSADGGTLWAACERLYRVNLQTLAVTPSIERRGIALVARPGGVLLGSDDGRVCWVGADGKLEHETALAEGTALDDVAGAFAALRDATLVESPSVKPHEVGTAIPLGFEFGVWTDYAQPRGDAIFPVEVAVRIPEKGRYRFTIDLVNPKEQEDKMGPLQVSSDGKTWLNTAPVNGDKWKQAVEIDLDAGARSFRIVNVPPWVAGGWKVEAMMRTLTVERVTP